MIIICDQKDMGLRKRGQSGRYTANVNEKNLYGGGDGWVQVLSCFQLEEMSLCIESSSCRNHVKMEFTQMSRLKELTDTGLL